MNFPLFKTLHHYKLKYLPFDIFSGLIVAAISIPISMGYAQVCGLPAVYGLYGSVFPILLFAIFSTSPQFVFGVDAAPCAVVGGLLASMGITAGSAEAIKIVPAITLFAALWLLLFSLLKAGKLVSFISAPVMGGFISGIAVTIILMQFPKLLGSSVGEGELPQLLYAIYLAFLKTNWISLAMGVATVAIILLFKKIAPKIPMAIIIMILGALSTLFLNVQDYGIKLLDSVEHGLPPLTIPSFDFTEVTHIMGTSLTVAIVIMAETLLSENNFALKNGYKINDNREIFTFSVANIASAFSGGAPINGSVSRTVMAEQFGGKTQLMSVVAGLAMIGILLFSTDFIGYLPVPVLTGIVIAALIGVIEFDVAKRLRKVSKVDAGIFFAAFFGVLILGTIYGVVIGVILSFVAVIIRAVNPERTFLGVINGKDGFFNLKRNRNARPVQSTVIYRFSGNLFFANVKAFQEDIENSISSDTRNVIVDAGGITSIDITAADRIDIIRKNLNKQGIKFYLTEHIGQVNDQLRKFGLGHLIDDGTVRRTITLALNDAQIYEPYPLEQSDDESQLAYTAEENNSLYEYEWAYGSDAEMQMELAVHNIIENIQKSDIVEKDVTSENFLDSSDVWIALGTIDEDELLTHLEMHLRELSSSLKTTEEKVEAKIERRRGVIESKLKASNPQAYAELRRHRAAVEDYLRKENPKGLKHLQEIHNKRLEEIEQKKHHAKHLEMKHLDIKHNTDNSHKENKNDTNDEK